MKTLHGRCAGLDVHKVEIVACLRLVEKGKIARQVRRFSTTTQGLFELVAWLEGAGCTHVAMEAIGVYWKPVWHILDGHFALILANAMHVKAVPGRKSDVNDATWLADLLAHGLIRESLGPQNPRENGVRRHALVELETNSFVGALVGRVEIGEHVLDVSARAGLIAHPMTRPARALGGRLSPDANSKPAEQCATI